MLTPPSPLLLLPLLVLLLCLSSPTATTRRSAHNRGFHSSGDLVSVFWPYDGGGYFDGRITAVSEEGQYDVSYSDSSERRVDGSRVHPSASSSSGRRVGTGRGGSGGSGGSEGRGGSVGRPSSHLRIRVPGAGLSAPRTSTPPTSSTLRSTSTPTGNEVGDEEGDLRPRSFDAGRGFEEEDLLLLPPHPSLHSFEVENYFGDYGLVRSALSAEELVHALAFLSSKAVQVRLSTAAVTGERDGSNGRGGAGSERDVTESRRSRVAWLKGDRRKGDRLKGGRRGRRSKHGGGDGSSENSDDSDDDGNDDGNDDGVDDSVLVPLPPWIHQRLAAVARGVDSAWIWDQLLPAIAVPPVAPSVVLPESAFEIDYEYQYGEYRRGDHYGAFHTDSEEVVSTDEDTRDIALVLLLDNPEAELPQSTPLPLDTLRPRRPDTGGHDTVLQQPPSLGRSSSHSRGGFSGGAFVAATSRGLEHVDLRAGDAIVFPARSLWHKVARVTGGLRRTIVVWASVRSVPGSVRVRGSLSPLSPLPCEDRKGADRMQCVQQGEDGREDGGEDGEIT